MNRRKFIALSLIMVAVLVVGIASHNPIEVTPEPEPEPKGRNGGPSIPPVTPDSTWFEIYVHIREGELRKREEVNNEGQ
ncbi:hypothetical protein [Pseudoalteromonas umbrosa]|uniref:hypothetical protein n=1 Tax=Pseudoalteromonas umbrosa TaxID=3048489 RepID=UPI0024C434B8|nr:hypothetical protein [Pseudoalteromonas sp. B95]MDK1288529.1 hypothetical protein [Pseudoalteromonas sp. B95]